MSEIGEALEAAWNALDAGDPETALEAAASVPMDDPGRFLVTAEAWIELGEQAEAASALEGAEKLLGADHEELAFTRGRLRILEWRPAEARAELERLKPDVFGAPLLVNLALAAEMEGDLRRADRLYADAAQLDPENASVPPRLSGDAFERCVAEAAEELPPEFRAAFERTAVVIDAMPTAEVLDAANTGHPPDTLGVFVGALLHENDPVPGELPPTIFLFQRNLERIARDHAELVAEIKTTLYHELGHALGFDEEGVDDMGLG